jgi:hypothetical protein
MTLTFVFLMEQYYHFVQWMHMFVSRLLDLEEDCFPPIEINFELCSRTDTY